MGFNKTDIITDRAYKKLSANILCQAIRDYQYCKKHETETNGKLYPNIEELTRFFKSEYADDLWYVVGIQLQKILDYLKI